MQKKPVLLISPLPPPQGGIATWTQKIIANGLPDNTPVTLVDTRIRGKRNIFQPAFLSLAEISRTFRIYFLVLYQLIAHRPKLVHLSCALSPAGIFRDLMCAWLTKMFGIPVLTHYHGNMQDFNGKRVWGLSAKALQRLLQISSVNIFANTPSLRYAHQLLGTDKNLILLPNFIEDSIFQETQDKQRATTRLRALYAGGITGAKGCTEILAMAKQFPQCDFNLFGKMHADMTTLYQNPPANVMLHGEVDHDQLLAAMRDSDFLLFPSYTEGFPLTVLEAMALGLAVIATTIGGIPEMIIDGKGGWLVAPRDSNALGIAMQTFMENPQQIAQMGQYNKTKSYAEFRYSIVLTRLISIYQQINPGSESCAV